MNELNRDEKIAWMAVWCAKNDLKLELDGSCGIGRDCVGIIHGASYPDYEWHDDNYNRADHNGEVWTPANAYHKHPCVAVLGLGEQAEAQLYEWLQWFDANGFKLETGSTGKVDSISILMGQHRYVRMVKQPPTMNANEG